MVDHIVQTEIHYHVCNIDGIDNCCGLYNCLFHDHNSYHCGHSHLCLNNWIVIIIIATTGGIELSAVALVLASIIILLSPSPLLRPSIQLPTAILAPVGSTASIVHSIILIVVIIIYIFILFFLFRERGGWLRLLLWFGFTFTFLSSTSSGTFE